MPTWFMVDAQMPNARVFHSALFTVHSAFNWSPRLVSRQRLLLFREALICLSYSGRLNEEGRTQNVEPGRHKKSTSSCSAFFLLRSAFKMVVPAGNAPASSGYQPGALLLSYRTKNRLERRTLATPLEVLSMISPGMPHCASCGSGSPCSS